MKTTNDLLKLVETKWHDTFSRFIETGDAPQEFLDYMDSDPNCQKAVELAFSAQAAAFESVARDLGRFQGRSVLLKNVPSPDVVVVVADEMEYKVEYKMGSRLIRSNPVAKRMKRIGKLRGAVKVAGEPVEATTLRSSKSDEKNGSSPRPGASK